MKVTNATVKGLERNARANDQPKEVPPLPLVPDETEGMEETTKTGSFKLRTVPADPDSPKYTFTMAFADGTQSIRFHIQWVKNCRTVFEGMAITTGNGQVDMIKHLCNGPIRTTFTENIEMLRQTARIERARAAAAAVPRNPGEAQADFERRQQAAHDTDLAAALDDATEAQVWRGLYAIIRQVCPYKCLEKQKRFMRRKMRKPADMKVRTYVNHLHRVNFEEIPYLPPQAPNQVLQGDEIIDIVVFGLPKSWLKEMDRMDFDPFRTNNVFDLVDFCERLESSEDFAGDQVQKNKNSKNGKKQKQGHGKKNDGDKWCDYHEVNTHNTIDCEVFKKLKAAKQGGDGKKPPFNKNKTWNRKSDDAKKEAKKELNALVKKVSQKVTTKVKKDLAATKRKSDDKDDDSDNSVNLLERQMADIDAELKEFDFGEEEGEVTEFEV
jgi:hypothetical protein